MKRTMLGMALSGMFALVGCAHPQQTAHTSVPAGGNGGAATAQNNAATTKPTPCAASWRTKSAAS